MTNHTSSTLMLFVVALLVTGIALALAVPSARQLGLPTGPWMALPIALLCYVGIFFAGREQILPEPLTRPPAKALTVLTVWIAVTMAAAGAVVWAVRLQSVPLGNAFVIIAIWSGCFVASTVVLRRVAGRRGGVPPRDEAALP